MRCPYCKHHDSKVLDTSHDSHGGIRRRRECLKCRQRFSSYERPILATPLLIKQDGAREEFDREKLARGVRIACAKRPVSAADIERHIKSKLPDAAVELKDLAGDNDHWAAHVVSSAFKGKNRVQQHQMVYDALGGRMGGVLHALKLTTSVPKA